MNSSDILNDSLHKDEQLESGSNFLVQGRPCSKIGRLVKGVMRGFVLDQDGNEITTHFYQEEDMVIASFIPNVNVTFTIQALEDCEITVANFAEVMRHVNKDSKITEIINSEFEKLNNQVHSRVVSLLNLDAREKYQAFMRDYPGLLNRIPHYYIAQYLGITPTQLSRVRKQFAQG